MNLHKAFYKDRYDAKLGLSRFRVFFWHLLADFKSVLGNQFPLIFKIKLLAQALPTREQRGVQTAIIQRPVLKAYNE